MVFESTGRPSLWRPGGTDDRFIHGAFALYRDFEGAGGRFGDVSVHASTDDVPRSAITLVLTP